MKHSVIASLFIVSATVSFNAHADSFLGLYAGAQAWDMGIDGGFAESENLVNFGFEDETSASFYVALEHPIPLIPNIKVAHTSVDLSGASILTSTFTFGGEVYAVDALINTDNDITTTDVILYYEFLDNDLVSFDFGVNLKYIDGEFFVLDESSSRSSSEDFTGIVPMGYARFAVGLPGTGLGVFAEGSALSIDDSSLIDYQVAVTYSFIESLAIDLTLQAGYRSLELDVDDIDDVFADLELDGPFVGVEFHF